MPEYEARTKARLAASVLERVYQGHKRTRQIVSARIRMDMRSTKAEQYMKHSASTLTACGLCPGYPYII